MDSSADSPWHASINETLDAIVEAAEETPPWYDAWQLLGPEADEEQRLRVYQAVRDDGCLPDEAGFYLVAWQADAMTSRRAETELQELDERMQVVREAHGLEDLNPRLVEDPPLEYEELLREYRRAWDAIYLEILEEHGEEEIARRFRNDPDEFERRLEAGRRYFHELPTPEPDHPEWLESFVKAVSGCLAPEISEASLGVSFGQSADGRVWEIDVFLRPVEIVGGPRDGERVAPGFILAIEELRGHFDRVDDSGWGDLRLVGSPNPQLWVEGTYRGNPVSLRILADPPEGQEPSGKLDGSNDRAG